MPNVAVLQGESRHESSAKQQQAAIRVRHPWENCSFTSFSAFVSTLNHQIFTYFVQRRSFLSSCYHLNLKQAFKERNLVPMTIYHGRCHWSLALYQVLVRMLIQKKKEPCLKNVKKKAICFKLFWFKVFVHWKLKSLNFLLDSVLRLSRPFFRKWNWFEQWWTRFRKEIYQSWISLTIYLNRDLTSLPM